jgi:hypothetical protein
LWAPLALALNKAEVNYSHMMEAVTPLIKLFRMKKPATVSL